MRREIESLLEDVEAQNDFTRNWVPDLSALDELTQRSLSSTVETLTSILYDEHKEHLRRVSAEALLLIVRDHTSDLTDDHLVAIAGGKPPSLRQSTRWYTHPETGATSPVIRSQRERPPAYEQLIRAVDDEGFQRFLWRYSEHDLSGQRQWVLRPHEKLDAAALIAKLKDPSPRTRAAAARYLGDIADARAVTPVIDALSDEIEDVRREAAAALRKLRRRLRADASTASAIAAALNEHPSSERRLP